MNNLASTNNFPVAALRADFPVLSEFVNGKPLVYLDSAATSQKPKVVLDRIYDYYSRENSTVRRGVYALSQNATALFEGVRKKIKDHLNAEHESEIVFVRGATEGINLVANAFGRKFLKPGDEVLITEMEHHANIVPWQIICEDRGAKLKVLPMDDNGDLLLENVESFLTEKTKIFALTHVSNALGTVNPVKDLVKIAHQFNVPVLVDGAQSAPHFKIDVQDLDCDFFVFSSHKVFGPTGAGVLYAKLQHLENMPPYHGGGEMIDTVTFEKTTYADPPYKFEAGTPPIAQVIGMGTAIDYINNIGLDNIGQYEHTLLSYLTDQIQQIPEATIVGNAVHKASLVSFILKDIHPFDIGTILDQEGIAIRIGHHCAQPVMKHFHIPATARASLAFYNTTEDIDRLIQGIKKVIHLFK